MLDLTLEWMLGGLGFDWIHHHEWLSFEVLVVSGVGFVEIKDAQAVEAGLVELKMDERILFLFWLWLIEMFEKIGWGDVWSVFGVRSLRSQDVAIGALPKLAREITLTLIACLYTLAVSTWPYFVASTASHFFPFVIVLFINVVFVTYTIVRRKVASRLAVRSKQLAGAGGSTWPL